jgi:PHP family Zn ribbon phosphoesterase
LKTFRAELHVHTVLSPCAGVEMIPPVIINQALSEGIQVIAITDHNSTRNVSAVRKAAQGSDITIIPGMELQTSEEVHVLCLFDDLDQLNEWQAIVDQHLPDQTNNPDFFGNQFIVDETGDFIENEDRLLLTSSSLSIDQAFQKVDALGGLFIPAHVNRKANGLIANLGMVPLGLNIEVLEITRHITEEKTRQLYPQINGYPLIQSGDVHFPTDFYASLRLTMEKPTISEIRKAILHQDGRHHFLLPPTTNMDN